MVARRGGALLLSDLLSQATGRAVVGPDVNRLNLASPDKHLHSIVDLEPVVEVPKAERERFRIVRARGYAGPRDGDPPQPKLDGAIDRASMLVLDDSANGFRHNGDAWEDLIVSTRPRWLIVKMARPLADSPMWTRVRAGPIGDDHKPHPERLIVVVNAHDLRDEKMALSQRLSWELTCEDFVRELHSNEKLALLAATGAHLLVRFSCDGVIYHSGSGVPATKLFFDPKHAEGEFAEDAGINMMGTTAAFTAGVAAALADDKSAAGKDVETIMDEAIKRGIAAAHRMAEAGFLADAEGAPDYPCELAMSPEPPPVRPIALEIPVSRIAAGRSWSILDDQLGDAKYAARRVISVGAKVALAKVPVAQFGELETADRNEIESYRAISNLLREYLSVRQTKPISIAVFGPPGAGKSFAVKQLVGHARPVGSKHAPPLEFNLSQFTKLEDLIAAFHLVRDQALSGAVPLAFFDEFDSNFGGELGWLRYFLAPMQDGEFREHGHVHPLGGAIFAFAGGTRQKLTEFVKTKGDSKYEEFAAQKGPDFASRLRGHIDIRGPDPGGDDHAYPIRRAFLLRSMLERREKSLRLGEGFNIDNSVLNALLTVGSYRHGARSMEAVLGMSALTGRRKFGAAALPPTEQLNSHVDAADFMSLVNAERLDDDLRDNLGRLLHEVYQTERRAIAEDDTERAKLARDRAMKDWDELPGAFRESSRLQADDIPIKLDLIGCVMARKSEGRTAVETFEPDEVKRLAEHEHERFVDERLREQWQLGERNPIERSSPFLIPWADLAEKWRRLDICAVIAIPQVLAKVGWGVYRKDATDRGKKGEAASLSEATPRI